MAAYATIADLVARYDERTLGDLVSDSGARAVGLVDRGNPVIETALETASGMVESYAIRGERYTKAQLAGLTGNSRALLVEAVCVVAFWMLWRRKPMKNPEAEEPARMEAQRVADDFLKGIGNGTLVFDVPDVLDAGLPAASVYTAGDLQRLDLFTERARGRFYPRRRYFGR